MVVPDRNMALELVRATEAASMAAGRWMGRGDKNGVDGAAVDAMRYMLNTVRMAGTVVIGEGEKDEAPMLFNGEHLGTGEPPEVDIAVDPVDGTTLTSQGRGGAVSVVAVSEKGTMYDPRHIFYMNKIITGPEATGVIDINAPVRENIQRVAKAKKKQCNDITVIILDRPRHDSLVSEIRDAGARIRFISDGDVCGALMTCKEGSGIDLLLGVGGSPEAVVTAAAMKCVGGEIQCTLWPRNEKERNKCHDLGIDLNQVLTAEDLVAGDNIFFALTGVTDGELVRGVRYEGDKISTSSLVMRSKSGTIRYIDAMHAAEKLRTISSSVEY
ncbi:MAG TPA: class II fructose-bisphosphatase [Synergistaceae bacterium]|nr:class II fructose-bisphosphatase [Synergistaceae bacterium]HPJ25486.1 class II fructose-bisphosphatase [Synergistaceae bacterium]HPQ36212.1 class II fructose-bisphosphatase [Synergistaceae bacterium]